ncbi:hypothetical protein BDQ17DRAFT_1392624 [Cyathus striatus]|nr:hypothetical protein BDQ17DRAFT_1392624 [Cyathus striatus]
MPALVALKGFITKSNDNTLSRLTGIPSLYLVLWHEKQTGSCYSMPKVQNRPQYPNLKHDQVEDKSISGRGEKCAKYYAQYSQQCLMGGIMVAWCTHSICYGFHCIPRSEGHNNVFLVLYTHWKVPPKCVIYDFACALGPYCMTREGGFFANIQFLINRFHASGTYQVADPGLKTLNSSAAECGNSVIAHIRKSISYMGQYHAMLYMRTFLLIWN